eukprot:TRINITY_DN3508_c0_g1_i2.p1 TRINITY_DN3508_c0_g1~~TRINITY_DN3508_c0_g1_i2.p1  ORF type:complete len:412 (+),score=78.10 TRINITY_DN3508_c0_g1_i2:695-1930(+)
MDHSEVFDTPSQYETRVLDYTDTNHSITVLTETNYENIDWVSFRDAYHVILACNTFDQLSETSEYRTLVNYLVESLSIGGILLASTTESSIVNLYEHKRLILKETRYDNFIEYERTIPYIESEHILESGVVLASCIYGSLNAEMKILALHGWMDNSNTFIPLAQRFMSNYDSCCILAVDFAGHGKSSHRHALTEYHVTTYCEDVLELVDLIGWEKFHILGHSMGGSVGFLVSGSFPERVESLTMIDIIGPSPRKDVVAPETLRRSILYKFKPSRTDRVYQSLSDAVDRFKSVNPYINDRSVRKLLKRGTKPVDGGLIFSHDKRARLPSGFRYSEGQIHAFCASIDCRVQIIWAEPSKRSYTIDDQACIDRVPHFKNAELFQVSGGHHVHLDSPNLVFGHIRRIFDQLNVDN